jgi:hypothetical protein
MYMGLMMLGRLKYIRQSHWCLSPVPLEVLMAIEKLKKAQITRYSSNSSRID